MKEILNVIPAPEGVRQIKRDEGKPFDLGPVHFRWKVRGEDSAHTYTMFELNLAPGGGVDLHSHSTPETFYVLEGEATFFHITNGEQAALVCDEGTTVMIPPNACTLCSIKVTTTAVYWMFPLLLISISSIR